MIRAGYWLNAKTDGGAFPCSLADLCRKAREEAPPERLQEEPSRSGIVFDGGIAPSSSFWPRARRLARGRKAQ